MLSHGFRETADVNSLDAVKYYYVMEAPDKDPICADSEGKYRRRYEPYCSTRSKPTDSVPPKVRVIAMANATVIAQAGWICRACVNLPVKWLVDNRYISGNVIRRTSAPIHPWPANVV